jgi:hypothetical protein
MAFLVSLCAVTGWEVLRRMKAGSEKDSYRAFRSELSESFPGINRLLGRIERERMVQNAAE